MRPHRLVPSTLVPALLALALPVGAAAQGTVSSQGLGYPPGQLSIRARATAGALGEFDPTSPLNPGALPAIPATSVFANFAPETRRVTLGGASDEARITRFPVVGAVLTVGRRGAIGISSSTLLDRSWATSQQVTTGGAAVTETFESRGALNDVRLAAGYGFGPRLQGGVGVHLLTGSNRLSVTRIDESGQEASFAQAQDVGFSGAAASAGVIWTPVRAVSVALDGQVGGTVRARQADTTFATATAPARAAAAVRYNALAGAIIAARVAWEGWSSLADLGSAQLGVSDVTEVGVGADIVGPRLFGQPLALRVGGRWRDLPFAALGEQPTEQAVTGGVGFALAGGRALVDVSIERARRSAAAARENAWTVGAGITVRP